MGKKFSDKKPSHKGSNLPPWSVPGDFDTGATYDPNHSLFHGHGKSTYTGGGTHTACYHSHPALKMAVGGQELLIYGGSCLSPAVKDADVYIGFDRGMHVPMPDWPWKEQDKAVHVYFPITDMSVPNSLKDFKDLISWTHEQLLAGKKVHCGCIGGHGRTGTFLAALVKTVMGEEDAIKFVRTNYCKKAVESEAQIEWLHQHFGIKKIEATKKFMSTADYKGSNVVAFGSATTAKWSAAASMVTGAQFKGSKKTYDPVPSKRSIFG